MRHAQSIKKHIGKTGKRRSEKPKRNKREGPENVRNQLAALIAMLPNFKKNSTLSSNR